MTTYDANNLRHRIKTIVGTSAQSTSHAAFAQRYHQSFQQSGIAKAASIIDDLRHNRSYIDLSKCAYFSIGGSAGDEVEHILQKTEMRFGLLLEYDDIATNWANKKSAAVQQELDKTLTVITGDAMQKIAACKQRLMTWRTDFGITGLIASAQAVLHELPNRSPNFNLTHFLGEVLWDWNPCLFYCREPCAPHEWPETIRLRIDDIESDDLEKLAKHVSRFLNIPSSIHRAGPRDLLISSTLAVELLHKLFYIDDFGHEIEEQLTSVNSQELVDVLESFLGPASVSRTHLNTTSFADYYKKFSVRATDQIGSKQLSPPLAFVAIVGERRPADDEYRSDRASASLDAIGSSTSTLPTPPSVSFDKDAATDQTRAATLEQYLDEVLTWADKIPGHAWEASTILPLSDISLRGIHVPLTTRERIAVCEDLDGEEQRILPLEIETKGKTLNCAENWRLLPMLAVETVMHYSRVLLVGRAGSGKTTTLRHLAYHAAASITARKAHAPPALSVPWWSPKGCVPVLLGLGETPRISATSADGTWQITSALDGPSNLAASLRSKATLGEILFLFDDIDMLPISARSAVEKEILALLKEYPDCSWLLTSQSMQWGVDNPILSQWFRSIAIAPLSPIALRDMIKSLWLSLRGMDSPDGAVEVVATLESAIDRFGLGRLASCPEILSSLVLIYAKSTEGMPSSRESLYHSILEVIESRWHATYVGWNVTKHTDMRIGKPLRRVIGIPTLVAAKAAYTALRNGSLPGGPFPPAVLYASADTYSPPDLVARGALTQFLEKESGLLIRTSDDELAFSNRAIQEFLAAYELCQRADFPSVGADSARTDGARWRNVLIMAAGLAGPDFGVAAVRALCPYSAPESANVIAPAENIWYDAWTAGEALAEIGIEAVEARPERREVLERVIAWLVQLIERGALSIHERHEVGITLSRLGDPRLGVCSELLDLCRVPAGPVMLGADGLSEAKPYAFDIPYDYLVAKYLVTNAQYARFLEDNPDADVPDDEGNVWSIRRRVPDPSYANHPVVGVTYLQASAYCAWLTECSRGRAAWPPSYVASLPTEAEWVKAYRGGITLPDGTTNPDPARRYPWGMDWAHGWANLPEDRSRLSQTTTVGLYQIGATPVGVLDAAGNVLEWTSTCWGGFDPSHAGFGHPYDPNDGRESNDAVGLRILRGGSWLFSEGSAKCACRLDPQRAFPDTGFRVFIVPEHRHTTPPF